MPYDPLTGDRSLLTDDGVEILIAVNAERMIMMIYADPETDEPYELEFASKDALLLAKIVIDGLVDVQHG